MRDAPLALLAVLAALTLAGCLGAQPLGPGGGGLPLPPLPIPAFGAPVAVSQEWPAAEPVLARAPDGTLYVEGVGRAASPPAPVAGNVNKVFRSRDGGTTWDDITPPLLGQERSNDGYLAVADDGTVYASNVFSLTFQLFRSTDQGASWEPVPVPRFPVLMHRHWVIPRGDTLHVTVEALPPSFLSYLAGVPPPAAQTGNLNEGMWYFRSDDAGATWSTPTQIDPVVNFAGQTIMVASADGSALYVGRYEEAGKDPVEYTYAQGRWYLLASEDGGATWERREMFDLTGEISTAVPGLALDPEGALSMAWTQQVGNTSRIHLAHSTDGGRIWSAPRELVETPGTHAMAFAAAKGPGALGVMWYTAESDGTASKVDALWFVDYAEVHDAASPAPRVAVTRVTPAPVHEGNICARGPACRAGEDRSLLDYPWMVFDGQGMAHLAFPSTAWDRPSAFAVYAGQLPADAARAAGTLQRAK